MGHLIRINSMLNFITEFWRLVCCVASVRLIYTLYLVWVNLYGFFSYDGSLANKLYLRIVPQNSWQFLDKDRYHDGYEVYMPNGQKMLTFGYKKYFEKINSVNINKADLNRDLVHEPDTLTTELCRYSTKSFTCMYKSFII